MFASVYHPASLTPAELDSYLARGWFRMGPTLFTTNFLAFTEQLYGAMWLRVSLPAYKTGKTQAKLFRTNSVFKTTIQHATLTEEKELLFAKYRASVPFEASASLQHLLFGKSKASVFDTYEISVHHGNRLIAVGYFDLGSEAGMGISSVYDPDFRKYSLGKYLIYLKMNYCRELGKQYFYPGYFVPGYSYFDYKLTMGREALEFLQFERGEWLPIGLFNEHDTPLKVMQQKLAMVKDGLLSAGIAARVIRYEFFDANLIPDLAGAQLFDFPLFVIYPGSVREAVLQAVTFDTRDSRYHLVRCRGVWKTNSAGTSDGFYSSYVLKAEETIYATDTAEDMIRVVASESQQVSVRTGTR